MAILALRYFLHQLCATTTTEPTSSIDFWEEWSHPCALKHKPSTRTLFCVVDNVGNPLIRLSEVRYVSIASGGVILHTLHVHLSAQSKNKRCRYNNTNDVVTPKHSSLLGMPTATTRRRRHDHQWTSTGQQAVSADDDKRRSTSGGEEDSPPGGESRARTVATSEAPETGESRAVLVRVERSRSVVIGGANEGAAVICVVNVANKGRIVVVPEVVVFLLPRAVEEHGRRWRSVSHAGASMFGDGGPALFVCRSHIFIDWYSTSARQRYNSSASTTEWCAMRDAWRGLYGLVGGERIHYAARCKSNGNK